MSPKDKSRSKREVVTSSTTIEPLISNSLYKGLFLFLMEIVLLFSLISAPEGAFREGDLLPAFAGWFLAFIGLVAIPFLFKETSQKRFQFHWVDGCVILLSIWTLLSMIVLWWNQSGNIRYAFNYYFLWMTAFNIYFFFRVLDRTSYQVFIRFFIVIIIAVVLAESFYAIYCYTIRDPAFRRAYLADPEAMLAQNGMYFPSGSPERILLENRILASSEPLGTYGLTNTLAGLLAPWLVLLIGIFVWLVIRGLSLLFKGKGTDSSDSREWSLFLYSVILLAIVIIPVSLSLILTKSRSGVLAFGGGIILYAVLLMIFSGLYVRDREKRRKRLLSISLLFGGIILSSVGGLLLALATGVLDKEVFSEAGKSFGYRLEYWRASCCMIQAHPWFGVGPGNFQNNYPLYMLAQSSETIADPHNFAFEVAAIFGIPALIILLCLFTGSIVLPFFRKTEWEQDNGKLKEDTKQEVVLASNINFVVLSSFSAIILVWFCSLILSVPLDFFFVLFFLAALVISYFTCFMVLKTFQYSFTPEQGSLAIDISLVVGIITALINLGAAGGIAYPSIFMTIWLFIAILVNRSCNTQSSYLDSSKRSISFLLILMVCFCLYVIFILKPAFQGNFVSRELEQVPSDGRQEQNLEPDVFCRADPWSISLAQQCYGRARIKYEVNMTRENRELLNRVRFHLLRTAPYSAAVRFQIGQMELECYENSHRNEWLETALPILKETVQYAPVDAKYRVLYAKALFLSGKKEMAADECKRALELDDQMLHKDRKLTKELRSFAEENK